MIERMSEKALKLWGSKNSHLKSLMANSQKPDKASLEGLEFLGLNVGFLSGLIGRRKFIKTFYMKSYGYGRFFTGNNFIVQQNKPTDEYVLIRKNDQPIPEGYFLVEYAGLNNRWHRFPQSALLNYGRADNAWYELPGLLRDYLVQPYPDNPNILLGMAYIALGPLTLPGGFFILERIK